MRASPPDPSSIPRPSSLSASGIKRYRVVCSVRGGGRVCRPGDHEVGPHRLRGRCGRIRAVYGLVHGPMRRMVPTDRITSERVVAPLWR